ncbi:hypothetical protein NC652_035082 [Populus alba x Populus x berolinensis]|nr:hypothetical protein NC652_035082 [Populus alba x Populus x berolinensis]
MGFVVEASKKFSLTDLVIWSTLITDIGLENTRSHCFSIGGRIWKGASSYVSSYGSEATVILVVLPPQARGPSSRSFRRRGGGDNESQRTSCPWSKVYFASRDKETRPCISIMKAYSFLAFSSATSITPRHLSCVSLPSSPAMSPPACTPVRVRRLPNLLIPSASFIPHQQKFCPFEIQPAIFIKFLLPKQEYRPGKNTKSPSQFSFGLRCHAWRHAQLEVCRPHVLWRTLVHIKRVRYERKPFGISLKDIRNVGLPSSKLESDVSPPSEHISSNVIQDSLYPVLKVCCTLSSRQLHLLKLRSCMCDLASQLFCSPIRRLHGGKTSPNVKMAKLPTLPIKHDFQITHSAATLAPLPASISAHLSGSCTKAIQEPATMPLPCDLSFQIRVLFQPCNLDSWISDGFANSISHSVTWGALHEFITFLSKVIE